MQGSRFHSTGRRTCALMAAALALSATAVAQATNANGDVAYVDGAAGRALADPARADGGTPPPMAAAQAQVSSPEIEATRQIMAAQRERMAQEQAGQAASAGAPFATPAQQVRAGMAQDAASLLDAGLQRQVYGPQGAVYAPYPGIAPLPEGIAPPPLPGGP